MLHTLLTEVKPHCKNFPSVFEAWKLVIEIRLLEEMSSKIEHPSQIIAKSQKSKDSPWGFHRHFIDTERNIKYLNVSGGFELNSFVSCRLVSSQRLSVAPKKGGTEWDPEANSIYS